MIILTLICLVIAAAALFAFIISLSFYMAEQKGIKEQKKQDQEYNQKMLKMCAATKDAGSCPHVCQKCAWGTRMKDGVVYFEKGKRNA